MGGSDDANEEESRLVPKHAALSGSLNYIKFFVGLKTDLCEQSKFSSDTAGSSGGQLEAIPSKELRRRQVDIDSLLSYPVYTNVHGNT